MNADTLADRLMWRGRQLPTHAVPEAARDRLVNSPDGAMGVVGLEAEMSLDLGIARATWPATAGVTADLRNFLGDR